MIGKEAWTNDMRVDMNTRNENWDKLEDLDTAVNDHLAENVYQFLNVTRDLSLSGIQTISTNFKPKFISINAYPGLGLMSFGNWAQNGEQGCIALTGNKGSSGSASAAVYLFNDGSWAKTGVIQNILDNSFEINWQDISGSPTGNVYLKITIGGHY